MSQFVKQTDKPLFPDVLWNRPLNRRYGGRLLIVGGQKSGFNECQAIYQIAEAAGAGECGLALPDSLERTVGPLGIGHFLPSSASGSLGKSALGGILELSREYDAVVIAGNLTNNAETAVLVESLIDKLDLPIVVGLEATQIMQFNPHKLIGRPKTLLVLDTSSTLKLAGSLKIPVVIQAGDSLMSKVELISNLADQSKCDYFVSNGQNLVWDQKIIVTDLPHEVAPEALVGIAATFWIQNQSKPAQGLATAGYVAAQAVKKAGSKATITNLANIIPKILDQEE
jgi:hypothetical protein